MKAGQRWLFEVASGLQQVCLWAKGLTPERPRGTETEGRRTHLAFARSNCHCYLE